MTGPPPAVAAARTAVRRALAALPAAGTGREAPDAPVLVACSGGPDSLALAAATAFVAPRLGRPAGAVVVDHGWHPGSAMVAEQAARQCRDLGLAPVEVVAVGPREDAAGGPEAAARDARYAVLGDVGHRLGAAAVLVGHTLDDQAESVLLGLARGSGGRSLAGMAASRPLTSSGAPGPLLLRPFLGLRRHETRQVCELLGLDAWDDPANADPAYTRSRLRRASGLLEELLGAGLPEALARTADLLREDARALDAAAAAARRRAEVPPEALPEDVVAAGGVGLDVEALAAEPDALRRRVLLDAARTAGSPAGSLGRRHVLALDALVVAWRGQGAAHLPGRVVGRRVCGRLLLAAAPTRPVPPTRVLPDSGPSTTE